MDYKILLDTIKKYKKITIFRHERPDGDAVFSAYAFAEFLKSNFKSKKVILVGDDNYDVLKSTFKVSDSAIKDSLCIVVDTATKERVDDKRCFSLAKYIIKIDHHPVTDNFGDINIVETKRAATCELLANIFLSDTFKSYKLTDKTKKYLFSGIVTDTMSFKTASCTSETFYLASKLLEKSKINVSDIYDDVFSKSQKEYNSISLLRKHYKSKGHTAYIIVNDIDMRRMGLTYDTAKNNIDILSHIQGINIWAIFALNKRTNLYDGSLRARNGYVINDIAAKYDGGGHKYASGVKNLTSSDISRLLNELNNVKKALK